jgi:uncharacterized protein YegP (UPF0339 family)/phosphatidylserine/phosphatidylglycerophosphate/cardiolipin synthase-like enzyme
MRFRSPADGTGQVFAVTGTNTVSFGIMAEESTRKGLLGFAVSRYDAASSTWRPLDGFKVFASIVPEPTPDLRVSSFDHPIQSFFWDDFTATPGTVYEYAFQPVKGRPGALEYPGAPMTLAVRTEPLLGERHDVFFNRGVASSQAYVRKFGSTPIDELPPENRAQALDWLSRDLDDALLGFVDACRAGDRLLGSFYEFDFEPAAAALRRAVDRGVDVRLVVDAKRNGSTDRSGTTEPDFPREENLAMLARVDLPLDRVVLREARSSAISHNKFMVRVPAGHPAAEVWTGSTNLSEGGVAGQTNVGHWVRDAEVADAFRRYWELLATDPGGRRGDAPASVRTANEAFRAAVVELSPVPADLRDVPVGTTAAFSPRLDDTLLTSYARLLDGADRQACITLAFGVGAAIKDVLADNTTRDQLSFLLLEKRDAPDPRKPHAFVRLNSRNNVYSAWGSRLQNPVYQWAEEPDARLLRLNSHVAYIHSKFLLVDPLGPDPVVVTGSANFSKASTVENDENMIVVRGDRRVADIYLTEFNRLFNHYYFRSVVEATEKQTSRRPRTGQSRFLAETDAWVAKYAQDSFRAKRLDLFASISGFSPAPAASAPSGPPAVASPAGTARFELFRDTRGRYRFRLKASNGHVIASSQAYTTKAAALAGTESVRNAGADAALVDLTEG